MSIKVPDWFWEFPEVEGQKGGENGIDDVVG